MTLASLVLAALVVVAVLGGAAGVAATIPPAPVVPGSPATGYPDAFPYGECTWWAAYNHPVTWSGDARDWLANAAADGVATSATPSVGAIVVYVPGGAYSALGHVAIVTAVTASSYRVSEMHAPALGVVSERTIAWPDPGAAGFIPAPPTR